MLKRIGWQPRSIILHRQGAVLDHDLNVGRDAGLFAGVQGVIGQLFEDRRGPKIPVVDRSAWSVLAR